jgi:Transcriptional regulator PadR-like family
MSAKIAVLGLVIEEPGPPHRLTAKLRQRLSSAEFVDSNVYSALTRLERDGLVRAVEEDEAEEAGRGLEVVPARSAPGRVSAKRTPGARTDSRMFEATPAGVRHFEKWLLASSAAPPLRDELHMKVALCQPHNLPRLIELVYGQELVCLGRVQELRRAFQQMQPPSPERWSGLVLVHVRDAELSFWDARLTWLQGVRGSLERMHATYCGSGGGRRYPA